MGSFDKKVVIIGAGFAGLQAVRVLGKKQGLAVTVVSPGASVFKPGLPELIFGKYPQATVAVDSARIVRGCGASFVAGEVAAVDTARRGLVLKGGTELEYDYLLVAAGSVPAFTLPGAGVFLDAADAQAVRRLVLEKGKPGQTLELLVVGGGYSGIELVTAVVRLCRKIGYMQGRFRLVERAPELLPTCSSRILRMTLRDLKRAGVELMLKSVFEVKKGGCYLNGDRVAPDILVVTAGFRAAAAEFLPQFADARSGRLQSDACLKVADRIFAAGDSVLFVQEGKPLRQSVNYAYYGGMTAARNILQEIEGRPLRAFRPKDPGFLIPNYATGKAYGKSGPLYFGGRFGMLLHSLMGLVRAFCWRQRMRILSGIPGWRQR